MSDQCNLLTSLIFGERPERCTQIAHGKRGNERITRVFFNVQKTYQIVQFQSNFLSESLIWPFTVSWATWANFSWSLICHEWPEQFAHSCSFNMSDLSDSLTVAHLSWGIWANCSQSLIWFEQSKRMSAEPMSKFHALEKFESAVCSTPQRQNFRLSKTTFYTSSIFFHVRSVHP